MTEHPAAPTTPEIPETMDAMPTHDNGCQCWPHVSRRDAERTIEAVALAEYRSARSTPAEALDVELIEAVRRVIEVREQQFSGDGLGRTPDEAGNRAPHSRWMHRFYVALDEMEDVFARLSPHNEEADHE